jgi:toxin ParE1/3/4
MRRKPEVRLTKRARDDLFDIFLFGYQQFGERQAERYAAGLEHAFSLLAANPRMGREAKSVGPGIRRHEHGSHVVFYEETSEGVLILAVLHARSLLKISL